MGLKILVIGSGGREHAICKKLLESPRVSTVFCAPGNAGMKRDGIQLVPITESEHHALIAFAKEQTIDWSFVGPEVPLLNGIVDDFAAAGLLIFGPKKAAALIEGSKDFAKKMMDLYDVPTAAYQTFTDFEQAQAYVKKLGAPIVIKADGLAAGKGVVVAENEAEAISALDEMLNNHKFGASSGKVVVEEFLVGEEFSLMAFVRNQEVYPMVTAQDHKRAFEQDRGPNTGGMGAYAPVPQIADELVAEAVETILKPIAKGLVEQKRAFSGILYAGLIATESGPKVIEFNARFGDPETQVVLQRLESDFAEVIDALVTNRQPEIRWKKSGFHLGTVIAANGYPEAYEKQIPLPDFSAVKDATIYFAGVEEQKEQLVSAGGRIYLVEAGGETLQEAQAKVYRTLDNLDTSGCFYRKDIGFKGMN